MAEQPPRYTYTPFPQSTSVHPLRPYYIPTDTNHYYTPSIGNSANLEDKFGSAAKKRGADSDSSNALRELSSFAFLKFFSTAFAQPFEVAKTLLQVQYLPNEDVVSIPPEGAPVDSDEEVSDDDAGFYKAPPSQPLTPNFRQTKPSDNQGYLLNTNIYDVATRPTYMLPPLEKGVWNTVGVLRKHPTEGHQSLWKGQFTNWVYEMAHLFLQPTVEGILNDTFDLYDDTIPLVYLDRVGPNIATLVTSHVVAGVLLSPLETVKTRLIVQTATMHSKYKGPFDCLRTMITEEGFSSLYWSHNLVPAIVHHAIGPLIECSIPLIIDRIFHISPNDSPFLYGLARLGLQTLQLLIILPIETIRKRLHCQIRSRVPGKRFETIVQMRQAPYVGMVDCVYRIIMEEGISQQYSPNRNRRRQRSWFDNYGISSLYGGFEMHFISNFMMFLVTAVNGVEDDFEDL